VIRMMRNEFPYQFVATVNKTSHVIRIFSQCSITCMLNVFRLLGSWNLQVASGFFVIFTMVLPLSRNISIQSATNACIDAESTCHSLNCK
jgi:hypothetical protein